ncbi:MAG: putative glycolipid-binding domain-containing protein [Methyloceanibacter sp.]|nr:putative glycolipid-binding domain-containing protein [Methyloceanibacter sp.]
MARKITPSPAHIRAVAWVKDEPFGVEFAEIHMAGNSLTASGVAVGSAPFPYRLDYALETGADFVTSRLQATSRGEGWRRELDLSRDERGAWRIRVREDGQLDLPPAGGDAERLAGALDCDLGLSPVTNMMPICRHGLLHGGGPVEFTMAWVAVPSLSLRPDGQRYRHLRSNDKCHIIRYEAIDGSFAADITVDGDAVVIDYPGIARRLSR